MARCMVCDFCDTAGSGFNVIGYHGKMIWDEQLQGFVCEACAEDPEFDPDYIDLDFDEEDE